MTDVEPASPTAVDPMTLEVGMLLLGGTRGREGEQLDTVWTVVSIGQHSATILAYLGTYHARATLRSNELPPGWKYVRNAPLAKQLRTMLEEE